MPHITDKNPTPIQSKRLSPSHLVRLIGGSLLLAFFAFIGTGGVIWVHQLTAERILQNQRQDALEAIHRLLPASAYDNDLLAQAEAFTVPRTGEAGLPVIAYRASRGKEPVATLLRLTTPDGYNGDIQLMVAVRDDGTLAGVEVVAHRETPGLGDRIESGRSDWLRQFDNISLGNPPLDAWRVKRDGGRFDQLTGATITPRAVVRAVRELLAFLQHSPGSGRRLLLESHHLSLAQ